MDIEPMVGWPFVSSSIFSIFNFQSVLFICAISNANLAVNISCHNLPQMNYKNKITQLLELYITPQTNTPFVKPLL
jgi:hypothetical protein